MKPIVYLLCGLPGSGKTNYAKKLEAGGALRLTVDEELFRRHGKDLDAQHIDQYKQEIKLDFKGLLEKAVKEGKSVALDYGFWKKLERDEYKQLAESVGAQWELLFFDMPLETLMLRIAERNITDPTSNHIISKELLEKFSTQLESPNGEGEEIIASQE